MATIGSFTASDNGFTGSIRTLTLNVKARFQRDFGSFSLMAYDTANIIFSAMKHRSGDEDMKRALLKYGPYAGVQQQTRFDDNGDTPRKVYYTEIRKGSFVQVK